MNLKLDVDGFPELTLAVGDMLSQLGDKIGMKITFEELQKTGGVCYTNDTGAMIISENENILGGYERKCSYPFFVVFRCANNSEVQKLQAAGFLEMVSQWLTGVPIEIGRQWWQVEIPELSPERKINKITVSNYYGLEPNPNGVQDWLLPVNVEYTQRKEC